MELSKEDKGFLIGVGAVVIVAYLLGIFFKYNLALSMFFAVVVGIIAGLIADKLQSGR